MINRIIGMGILSSLFTGFFAVIVGIFLGFIVAGIIGVIVWGIVTLRNRLRHRHDK